MLERTLDGAFVNSILNSPECVKGVFCGYGPIDVSQYATDPQNYCLFDTTGGLIFCPTGPGEYEGHAQFLKAGRGPRVLEATKEALAYMFRHTDAERITGWAPESNRAIISIMKKLGFKKLRKLKVLDVRGTEFVIGKADLDTACHS